MARGDYITRSRGESHAENANAVPVGPPTFNKIGIPVGAASSRRSLRAPRDDVLTAARTNGASRQFLNQRSRFWRSLHASKRDALRIDIRAIHIGVRILVRTE